MAIEFSKNLTGVIIGDVINGIYNTKYPYAVIEIPDGYEVSINDAILTFNEMEQILAKMKELQDLVGGSMKSKSEFAYLTVIIRDDAQLIHCGGPPTYRRVTMRLTDEQISAIKLFATSKNMGNDVYESISSCFLEKQIHDH